MFGQKGDEGPRGFPGLPGPIGLQVSRYTMTHLQAHLVPSVNTRAPDHVERRRARPSHITLPPLTEPVGAKRVPPQLIKTDSISSPLTSFTLHQKRA